jgi:integrase
MPRPPAKPKTLSSGRKQIRYRDQKGRLRKETFDTTTEAQSRLEAVRTDVRRGTFIDPRAGLEPFRSFAPKWAKSRDWAGTTKEGWPAVLARLDPYLGDLSLSAIDLLVLQAAQAELVDRYARSTVVVTMSTARAVMRTAYATGRIGRDPTVGLEPPKVRGGQLDDRVRPENVPTRAEVLAILAGAPSRWRAALALGVAGLRVGEVLAVSGDRLNRDRTTLLIDRQLQRIGGQVVMVPPKRDKVRSITLPAAVALEVRRHIRDHQGGGLLFRGGRGAPMRRDYFYRQAWRPALIGAGLTSDRFVFHSLRHFAASSMLAEGAPITAVAGHLGDTVETIQRVYSHWLRDDRDIPAAVLDRVLAVDLGGSEEAGS